MVACLTCLTSDAPRWTLVDSSFDGVHSAANALTTFALAVVVFLALLVVFPLESVQVTSADLRPAPDALDHRKNPNRGLRTTVRRRRTFRPSVP